MRILTGASAFDDEIHWIGTGFDSPGFADSGNIILYGELGRYPVEILIKTRMIWFWQRIINGKVDKISYKLYSIILNMSNRNLFHSKWITAVKSILTDSVFEHLWINQDNIPMTISKKVKFNLIEKYKDLWKHLIFDTPKCLNYRIFKQELKLEK